MVKKSKSTDSTSTKRPLVNWFSRQKSKTKENTDSTFSYKKNVTAPESILSRGFKKEKKYKNEYGNINDSTSYDKYETSTSKEKMPNKKGGGGKKTSYSKTSLVYGNNELYSGSFEGYGERTRKPSQGMRGVSKIRHDALRNDSTLFSYDKKTVSPKLSKPSKKTVVNPSDKRGELTKIPTLNKKGKNTKFK